jgi:hypothetical protein
MFHESRDRPACARHNSSCGLGPPRKLGAARELVRWTNVTRVRVTVLEGGEVIEFSPIPEFDEDGAVVNPPLPEADKGIETEIRSLPDLEVIFQGHSGSLGYGAEKARATTCPDGTDDD